MVQKVVRQLMFLLISLLIYWYYFKVSGVKIKKIDAGIYDTSDSLVKNTVSNTDKRYNSDRIGFWANSQSGFGYQNKYRDELFQYY